MLNCQQLTELVTDFMEGKMPFADRLRFKMHVAMCPSCKRYLDQTELTVMTLGEFRSSPIPEDVRSDLMAAFRDWKS